MFWRPGFFRSLVALFCLLIGALMFVSPHQFDGRLYLGVRPLLPWWGLVFVLVGSALIGAEIFATLGRLRVLAHALTILLLLTLAAGALPNRAWLGLVWYGVLALGILIAARTPHRLRASKPLPGDLLSLAFGISSFLSGVILIALPSQLAAPIYDPVRGLFPLYDVGFTVGGLVVAGNQLRPIRSPLVVRAAHLLVGASTWAFAVPYVPLRGWIGISYCVLFGGAIAVEPWVKGYLRRLDPSSLRLRLLVTSSLIAGLALIAIVALSTAQEEQTATAQALDEQQARAGDVAADVADFVDKEHIVLTTLANRSDLADLNQAALHELLQTSASGDAEVGIFAASDVADNAIALRDSFTPASGAGLSIFDEVRRTHGFALDLTYSPVLNTSVVALGAPFDDRQGRFAGVLVNVVEVRQLAPVVARGRVGDDGRAFLIDGSGHLIVDTSSAADSRFADVSARPSVQAFLHSGQIGAGSLIYGQPGSETIAGYAGIPSLGWGLVVERPLATVLAATRAGQDTSFLALVAICALAAVSGAWLADRLVRPLQQLGRAVSGFAEDGKPVPLPVTGVTEIAQVATAFDDLQIRLIQRNAERERLLAAERAARADADVAVGVRDEFLSVAAHELKTPLTTLLGTSQLALRRMASGKLSPGEFAATLRRIDVQTHRLGRLVDQLLDISRIQGGRLTLDRSPANLVSLVADVVAEAQARGASDLVVRSTSDTLVANVDPLRIEQVLTNLVDNAVKYAGDGGPIEMTVEPSGANALISVRDHGPGIPIADRDRVFERFFRGQTHRYDAGMGLGLAICQEIVLLHVGQISCEFPTDGGTRFVVRVPLT